MARKYKEPLKICSRIPFYISTNALPDFGDDQEIIESRLHIFKTKTMPKRMRVSGRGRLGNLFTSLLTEKETERESDSESERERESGSGREIVYVCVSVQIAKESSCS